MQTAPARIDFLPGNDDSDLMDLTPEEVAQGHLTLCLCEALKQLRSNPEQVELEAAEMEATVEEAESVVLAGVCLDWMGHWPHLNRVPSEAEFKLGEELHMMGCIAGKPVPVAARIEPDQAMQLAALARRRQVSLESIVIEGLTQLLEREDDGQYADRGRL